MSASIGPLSSIFLGVALASGSASAQVDIEVSEGAREFRVVVSSEHPVSFDVEQLLPPAPGLTPARVGALGRTADGATVGCDRNAEPSFAYTVVSGTNAATDPVSEVVVSAGAPFRTPWHSSGRLLDLLDRCRGSARAPAYTMFKIVVELDTTGGPVLKETAWLSLPSRDDGAVMPQDEAASRQRAKVRVDSVMDVVLAAHAVPGRGRVVRHVPIQVP